MADEYLWDRTGPVDPEVAHMEAVLAGLRMSPSERAPSVSPRVASRSATHGPAWSGTLLTAVLAAAATMALIWAWARSTGSPTSPPTPPQIVIIAPTEPPAPVAAPAPSPSPEPVPAPVPPAPPVPPPPDTVDAPPVTPPPTVPRPRRKTSGAARDGDRKRAAASPSESLPDRLTAAEIKAGIAPHKDRARACGRTHGAMTDDKVLIKLSIEGATGKVVHATATGAFAGTALGKCVVKALAAAEFPRFRKVAIGVQYPVRMP